jgi:hypothetical protein
LKRFCNEHGFSYRNVESTEYGTVLAFHIDGVNAARDYLLNNPDALARYRKVAA